MKKGKITMTITLGMMCFVLVYVMFMQFKVVEETDITEIENMREAELTESLADWKSKCKDIEAQIKEKQAKIDEYNGAMETNKEASEILGQELQNARMLLGVTDVTGDGIIITLEENKETQIDAALLLELINELKLADAEAISINNQRVVAMTDIVDISNGYILINSERIVAPFKIKVIGEQTYLESALNIKNAGFVDKYTKIGYDIKVEKKDNIEISKFNGDMTIKYIENN